VLGIPILKLLNGKTSAYNSSFLFFIKVLEDLGMKSLINSSKFVD
jgi:hypothetical protein